MIEISTLTAGIIAAIGLALTLLNIADKIMMFRDKAKKPEEEYQMWRATTDNDIISIKNQLLVHERYFTNDREQMEEIRRQMKKSNIVIIQSLQALITHSLDGNAVDELHHSKKGLDEYLLGKELL